MALVVGAVFAVLAAVVFAADGRLFTAEFAIVAIVAFALPLLRTATQTGGQKAGRSLRDGGDA